MKSRGLSFAIMLAFLLAGAACSDPVVIDTDGDSDVDSDMGTTPDADQDADNDDADKDEDVEDADPEEDADPDELPDGDPDGDLEEADVEAEADVEEEDPGLDIDDDEDGFTEREGDCDDTNPDIYPESETVVPDRDYNCDGMVEWQAHIWIAVDDEYDLCVDGVDIGSGGGHSTAQEWVVELQSGSHVLGFMGTDVGGVATSGAVRVRVAGMEFASHGIRSRGGAEDDDTTAWRYFHEGEKRPQADWCDQGFDDSEWGPALISDEMGDGVWIQGAPQLRRNEVEWIWDGNPSSLADSWFRRRFSLPYSEHEVNEEEGTCTATEPVQFFIPHRETGEPTAYSLYVGTELAWDGTNVATLVDSFYNPWRRGVDELFFKFVTTSGEEITEASQINAPPGSEYYWNSHPGMAYSGSGYGVVWEDGRHNRQVDQVYFRALDETGAPQGSADLRIVSTSYQSKYPVIVFGTENYYLIWQDERDGQREIYGVRVSEESTVVGAQVRITNSAGASRTPAIAFNTETDQLGIAWQDSRHGTSDDNNFEIYFRRTNDDLSAEGDEIRITDDEAYSGQPSLAFNGTDFGLAWAEEQDRNREIYFVLIDDEGTVGDPVRVTNSAGVSAEPKLIPITDGWAIAFRDTRREGYDDIYIVELDSDGIPVEAPSNVSNSDQRSYSPEIVSPSDGVYSLLWEEEQRPVDAPFTFYPFFAEATCE